MNKLIIKKINDIQEELLCNNNFNVYHTNLFSRYYEEYYKNNFFDHSFCVFLGDQIVAFVLVTQINKQLTYTTKGIEVIFFSEYLKQEKDILNRVISYLEEVAHSTDCDEIIFKDKIGNGIQSQLGEKLLLQKYHPEVLFDMRISFKDFNVKTYFTSIRKSYKSLINWGEKNLEVLILNKNNLCESKFKEFKEFHIKISGHQTRSDLTWDIQYQQIAAGYGELILGYLKKRLVAGSLILDQNEVSNYAVGVYERDLFKFGLSHFILYKGICRSFERGKTKHFSLGLFESTVKDPKVYNIQFFKKGFCPILKPVLIWIKTTKQIIKSHTLDEKLSIN